MPRALWLCGCGEAFPTRKGVQNHQNHPIRLPATPFSAVVQGMYRCRPIIDATPNFAEYYFCTTNFAE
jgi:hypothetical protein